jgi:SnoaL-like polyketide cyclase
MSKEQENKAIVGRWFKEFWGNPWNPRVVDELATPDILLQYSLHAPRRGREEVKKFMTGFREAFPDLEFWGAADLIAEGDHVVGRWEGGGTHTGPAFSDFLVGLPSGGFRSEDALYRNDGAPRRKRQDRRGSRPRRRSDCTSAARHPKSRLIEKPKS